MRRRPSRACWGAADDLVGLLEHPSAVSVTPLRNVVLQRQWTWQTGMQDCEHRPACGSAARRSIAIDSRRNRAVVKRGPDAVRITCRPSRMQQLLRHFPFAKEGGSLVRPAPSWEIIRQFSCQASKHCTEGNLAYHIPRNSAVASQIVQPPFFAGVARIGHENENILA